MRKALGLLALALSLAACGGGGGDNGGGGGLGDGGCTGDCFLQAPTALTAAEVERIVAQAAQEAQARGAPAVIAVVDRVGNVLAVYRMAGAPPTFTISSQRGVVGGLEGVDSLPAELAAIAKAITAAYLSSEGHAFSTRTASQIVQENFNPGELNSPAGPLFGVQFSSLNCSDVVRNGPGAVAGPKGSPLGLAADPGGLPLYKGGQVVGGIGVLADGVYGLDRNVFDLDQSADELIAVAGARGFDAPPERRASVISVDGRTLRYVDSEALATDPATAPPLAALPGAFVNVPGYYTAGAALAGTVYGTPASGIRPAPPGSFGGLPVFVLDDGSGGMRFAPSAGTDGGLSQAEVTAILTEAIRVARRTRAQIRRPLGSPAQVSVAIVDSNGALIGLVRTPDAPVFGADVAVQKARAAVFFSHPDTASELAALPAAVYPAPGAGTSSPAAYLAALQGLIGPDALANGIAFSSRAVGNLARPFLPDGINAAGPGPLSRPFGAWSPFSTGLQLDLVLNRVVANLLAPPPPGIGAGDCVPLGRARGGVQIFPGSVPIYRGATLVGGIGVSGDGVDQDDLIAILAVSGAGAALATGISNAPFAIRADTLVVPGGNLRYVSCPVAPFLDSTVTNVCYGV